MTDSDHALTARPGTVKLGGGIGELHSEMAVTRHLRRLATAYSVFNFSREFFGWKGARWVAERRDRSAPGLRVVITGDLMELRCALQRDKAASRAR